jgi:hypothetical protein
MFNSPSHTPHTDSNETTHSSSRNVRRPTRQALVHLHQLAPPPLRCSHTRLHSSHIRTAGSDRTNRSSRHRTRDRSRGRRSRLVLVYCLWRGRTAGIRCTNCGFRHRSWSRSRGRRRLQRAWRGRAGRMYIAGIGQDTWFGSMRAR